MLLKTCICAIIIKRDCNRYAMKRKVAGGMSGNFRGVCPILNRAKEFEWLEPLGNPQQADVAPFKG